MWLQAMGLTPMTYGYPPIYATVTFQRGSSNLEFSESMIMLLLWVKYFQFSLQAMNLR
jgi:hypothetical protein